MRKKPNKMEGRRMMKRSLFEEDVMFCVCEDDLKRMKNRRKNGTFKKQE